MLLKRYNDINFIMDMDSASGYMLISEAFEQEKRDKAYMLYVNLVPNMTSENFISFEEYYKMVSGENSRMNRRADVKSSSATKEEKIKKSRDIVKDIFENYQI